MNELNLRYTEIFFFPIMIRDLLVIIEINDGLGIVERNIYILNLQ